MIKEEISIKRFNSDNESDYKELLITSEIPNELCFMEKQELKRKKNVFVLVKERHIKILFFTIKSTKVIGYCNVEDFRGIPEDWREHIMILYSIPLEILQQYPIVISDCVIRCEERRKNYGTKLANHIINDVYKDDNICLYAIEDGPQFWNWMGFSVIADDLSIMGLVR